jgi:hypothetical protein
VANHQPAPQVTLREASAGEACPLLARVDAFDTTNGRDTVASMAAVGRCFVLSEDGRDIGAYVLQRQGDECYILAAAGQAEFDMTAALATILEGHARGLKSIAFQTRRPGLVRKARKYGYRIAGRVENGVIMRKELT